LTVATIAHGSFKDTTSFLHSSHSNFKLINVIESIEDSENIHAVLLGLLDEVVDGVIRKRLVRNAVGTTQQHLERDVGNQLPHLSQSVPRILIQEAHGYIEGSSTPAFQCIGIAEGIAGFFGNIAQIDGSYTSGQERLVSITPGCVHNEAALIGSDSLSEGSWALLVDDVLPSLSARNTHVDGLPTVVEYRGHDYVTLEFGLANLTFNAAAIDGKISEVLKQLLSTVLTADQLEQLGSIIDECRPARALNEDRVREKGSQERNVGLDTTDAELNESSQHLATHNLVG
jgi:hypothetical protein